MRVAIRNLVITGFLLFAVGCGVSRNDNPRIIVNHDAIYVANTESSSISAFQLLGPILGPAAGPVAGSPFHVGAPPTALAGDGVRGFAFVAASGPARTISGYRVDFLTSVLTGPSFTFSASYTPTAVAEWRGFLYVASLAGGVWVYQAGSSNSLTELSGSPFPGGSGPVSLSTAEPGLLYVANSLSNDVSAFALNPTNGALTPVPRSPYPAGKSPAWIDVSPAFYPAPVGGPTLVIVANSGSNDISVYTIAANGALGPVPGSPFAAGDGPCSIGINDYTFPLKYVYVSNCRSNNISGYSIDQTTGVLTPLAGFPVAAGVSPSSLAMSGGDGFLYAANTGSDNLSVFHIDINTGALTPVSGSPFPVGRSPRAVLYFQVPQ